MANSMTDSGIQDEGFFFEGVEKLLEVWFQPKQSGYKFDLREILPEKLWSNEILPVVGCEILNKIENSHQDSYVLSESSLFVTENRYILKTCGKTKCLKSIPLILDRIQALYLPIEVSCLFYSRKNFAQPEKQDDIYCQNNFQPEVKFLDDILADFCSTKAVCLGQITDSRWFMYSAENLNFDPDNFVKNNEDMTLEVIMTDCNRSVMNHFYEDPEHLDRQNQNSDISDQSKKNVNLIENIKNLPQYLNPKINILYDGFQFSPCGYSSNSLIQSEHQKDAYSNLHITPEEDFNYVSYECNLQSDSDIKNMVGQVVKLFQPQSYMVTLVYHKNCSLMKNGTCFEKFTETADNLVDGQFCTLGQYRALYSFYRQS